MKRRIILCNATALLVLPIRFAKKKKNAEQSRKLLALYNGE